MEKPIIVIADEDIKYLVMLETKFLVELQDSADIQIINDIRYFNYYFKESKNIDVLVISENLYTRDLQKHNIANIFVLTESQMTGGTEDLFINKIYKYASIDNIFDTVIASRLDTVELKQIDRIQTKVIVITSFNGGIGKSTVSLGVSGCLSQLGKNVLYIDAEEFQLFSYWFNNEIVISDKCVQDILDSNDLYLTIKEEIVHERFDYMPAFPDAIYKLNIRKKVYSSIIKQFKDQNEYDFIIVDTDSVVDHFKYELFELADQIILILGQDTLSYYAAEKKMKDVKEANHNLQIIWNKFDDNNTSLIYKNDFNRKLSVKEYVKYIDKQGDLTLVDMIKNKDIQRVSYLLV